MKRRAATTGAAIPTRTRRATACRSRVRGGASAASWRSRPSTPGAGRRRVRRGSDARTRRRRVGRAQPLITPIGRRRATLRDRPARCTTSTTCVDVLVGLGLLLGEAVPAAGAGDDARARPAPVDAPPLGRLDRRRAAHRAARAVAGGAEGLLHAPAAARPGPSWPAPCRRGSAPAGRSRGRPRASPGARREGARGALAVNPEPACVAPSTSVLLELGDVVGHVVDQLHARALPGPAEELARRPRAPATSAAAGCTRRSWRRRASRRGSAGPRGCRPARRRAAGRAARCRSARARRAAPAARRRRPGSRARASRSGSSRRPAPPRGPNAAAASASSTSSTTCTSRKWLPEPSVPHWSAPALDGARR